MAGFLGCRGLQLACQLCLALPDQFSSILDAQRPWHRSLCLWHYRDPFRFLYAVGSLSRLVSRLLRIDAFPSHGEYATGDFPWADEQPPNCVCLTQSVLLGAGASWHW